MADTPIPPVRRLGLMQSILMRHFAGPSETPTGVDPETLSDAVTKGVVRALSKFSTKDGGALKIVDSQGVRPYGGG